MQQKWIRTEFNIEEKGKEEEKENNGEKCIL